jgi:hypothetical protein
MAALVLADLAMKQLARAGSMLIPTSGGGTAIATKTEVSQTVQLVNTKKRKR